MRAYERFLNYVRFHTTSSEDSGTHPSTERQRALAEVLAEECRGLGMTNVRISDDCYLYAELSATEGYESAPVLGLIAHMDTSPDFSGEGVTPILHENYDGGEIALGASGRVLSPEMFPSLKSLVGRTLITTDGTTLLGADDKAGIAEILTGIERIQDEKIPHGALRVAFTPDEEIGEGADGFDVSGFGADFAYTLDGGAEGSLEYENFNALGAEFTVHGVNVHPGSAKDVMINAALVATELSALLPKDEIPARTEGYEGFYHLTDIAGSCERATLKYIVRDHDATRFEQRRAVLYAAKKAINEKYGEGTVTLTVRDQYRNMASVIAEHFHLIENAKKAASLVGLAPTTEPIRGGTDGARLSFMGLPCPNLGTGGHAFHGPYEHITVEGMDLATNMLLEIVKLYANQE